MYYRKLHVCCPKLDVQETNFCSTESEIISRLNPAKDGGADRVFSSFVVCGGACLQGFVPGHGPTTLTRLQKCAQDIEQTPNFYSGPGISLSILPRTQIMDHVDLNMPKISIQESVEAAENVLQERIPERDV